MERTWAIEYDEAIIRRAGLVWSNREYELDWDEWIHNRQADAKFWVSNGAIHHEDEYWMDLYREIMRFKDDDKQRRG